MSELIERIASERSEMIEAIKEARDWLCGEEDENEYSHKRRQMRALVARFDAILKATGAA